MKKYEVTIEEILTKNIEVTAESEEAALRKVQDEYYSGKYVLDAENFAEVSFRAGEPDKEFEKYKECSSVEL